MVTASLLDVDTIVISSSVPRDFVVCLAVAHDADIGANSRIDFQLVTDPGVDHHVSELFAIDSDTGEISVVSEFVGRNSVRDDDAREYLLTVRACDAGRPPRCVDALLRVVVNGSLQFLPSADAPFTTHSLVAGRHVTLVLVIAGSSALVMVALVVAIAAVRIRGRKSRRRFQPRSLTSDDMIKSTVTSFETVPLSSTFCSNDALHASTLLPKSHENLANGTVHVTDNSFHILSSEVGIIH